MVPYLLLLLLLPTWTIDNLPRKIRGDSGATEEDNGTASKHPAIPLPWLLVPPQTLVSHLQDPSLPLSYPRGAGHLPSWLLRMLRQSMNENGLASVEGRYIQPGMKKPQEKLYFLRQY